MRKMLCGNIISKIKKSLLFAGVMVIFWRSDINVCAAENYTLEEVMGMFPNGKYWNHQVTGTDNYADTLYTEGNNNYANTWSESPCENHGVASPKVGTYDCNVYDKAMQCYGYALRIENLLYGTNPRYWPKMTYSELSAEDMYNGVIKAGDYITYYDYKNPEPIYRTNSGWGHTCVVIAVSGEKLTLAEVNAGGTCQISWGREVDVTWLSNVKVYSAPCDLQEQLIEASIKIPRKVNGYYCIENCYQLRWFAELVNGTAKDVYGNSMPQDLCANAILVNDIDYSLLDGVHTPIGTISVPEMTWDLENAYRGTFNGANHIVTGITGFASVSGYSTGFFGHTYGAKIINLGLEGVDIEASCYRAGGLIGTAYDSTIKNCHVTGKAKFRVDSSTGFFIGNIYAGRIEQCYVQGEFGGTDFSYMGGFLGAAGNININNCYADVEYDSLYVNYPYIASFIGGDWVNIYTNCYSYNSEYTNFYDYCYDSNKIELINCYSYTQHYNEEKYYEGFDFENIWEIADGAVSPKLKSCIYETYDFDSYSMSNIDCVTFEGGVTLPYYAQKEEALAYLPNEAYAVIEMVNGVQYYVPVDITWTSDWYANVPGTYSVLGKVLYKNETDQERYAVDLPDVTGSIVLVKEELDEEQTKEDDRVRLVLEDIAAKSYGTGSYFTVNGLPCVDHTGTSCSNCLSYTSPIVNYKASQCAGFVLMLTDRVFGYGFNGNQRKYQSSENEWGYQLVKTINLNDTDISDEFNELRVGDVMLFNSTTKPEDSNWAHLAMYLSKDDAGIYLYEANVHHFDITDTQFKNPIHDCRVVYNSKHRWANIAKTMGTPYVHVYRIRDEYRKDAEPVYCGGLVGWDAIIDKFQDTQDASVTITTFGETTIPKYLFELAHNNNIEVTVYSDKYYWVIKSSDIVSPKDISLQITAGQGTIPTDVVDKVDNLIEILNINYTGEFGLNAKLNYKLGTEYKNYSIALFYYNEKLNKLEMEEVAIVDEQGYVSFDFTHASSYVLVAVSNDNDYVVEEENKEADKGEREEIEVSKGEEREEENIEDNDTEESDGHNVTDDTAENEMKYSHVHKFVQRVYQDEKEHELKCECGESEKENHIYGEWVSKQDATAGEMEEKRRSCIICDYSQVEYIGIGEKEEAKEETVYPTLEKEDYEEKEQNNDSLINQWRENEKKISSIVIFMLIMLLLTIFLIACGQWKKRNK